MRALVTGAAGFIGSNLVDQLLAEGHDVVGVDCFTDYYDPVAKNANLEVARSHNRFELVQGDLTECDLERLLEGVDTVFHLAGQPGVRLSWADEFETYGARNILATQRLLEAARDKPLARFVYASSSSVYGAAQRYPTQETDVPAPMSPYGVTKLAAEHLCGLYHNNFGIPTVSLRYFTVYGPRQRPDMATYRLIKSALTGSEFVMFGDGSQIREFTYVGDVVAANIAAAAEPAVGAIFNIGGGASANMHDVIEAVTEACGTSPNITFADPVPGDVHRTGANISLAREALGWEPAVGLAAGVAAQAEAQRTAL